MGGIKIQSNRILISKVGINNNSPTVFKRFFHTTNSLRGGTYNMILETLNILQLQDIQFIISNAVIHLQMQDYNHESVTNAVQFLITKTKTVDTTQAECWGFNLDLLQRNGIESPEALEEFKKTEKHMQDNLYNINLHHQHVKDVRRELLTKEAATLARIAN